MPISGFDDLCERWVALPSFVRSSALCLGVLSGFASVLVDDDHIPAYVFEVVWSWVPSHFMGFGIGRNLHGVDGVLFGCLGTLACGLLFLGLLVLFDKNSRA